MIKIYIMTHRNRQDQFSVSCKISDVTVQGDTFLCCASFANGQWYTQNSIGPKLSWRKNKITWHMDAITGAETHHYVIMLSSNVMWIRLTFVVSAVHFNHRVVQFLLLQHTDSLKRRSLTYYFSSLCHLFYFSLALLLTDWMSAGARVSLMWPTALVTPMRYVEQVNPLLCDKTKRNTEKHSVHIML